jgi:hypothetical protein
MSQSGFTTVTKTSRVLLRNPNPSDRPRSSMAVRELRTGGTSETLSTVDPIREQTSPQVHRLSLVASTLSVIGLKTTLVVF